MNIKKFVEQRQKEGGAPTPQEQIKRYAGMDEEQLMREMFRAADQGRRDGTLNNQTLDAFYQNARAFLTPEQAERMKELIAELKK